MIFTEQSVGIFTTDTQLVVRSWDAWLANVTGMLPHIVRGVNLVELFPELESRLDFFQQVLLNGVVIKLSPPSQPYLIPCMLQVPSKYFEYMQQVVTLSPLRDRDRMIGMIVTVEDVTQQHERECDLIELNNRLKSPDETTRLQAVQRLAVQAPGAMETSGLFDVLGDKSWQVREVAVLSLIQRGGTQAIATLVRRIQEEHQDFSLLNSALKALAQIEGDVVTPLAQLLVIDDDDLRGYAALALGEQNDRRAIPVLIQALNDSNMNVRYNAVEALGKLGAVEAVSVLADLVESSDFFLAFPALESLKKIGDPSILPRITALLNHEVLCEPAIETLGQLGNESVVAPLVQLLSTREDLTLPIVYALTALYERYDELYGEGNRIAEKIHLSMSDEGINHLLNHLETASKTDLRYFALVLGCLEGEQVEYTLVRLMADEESPAQTEVLQALVRFGPRVVHLLIGQLKTDNVSTCQSVIYALGKIRDKQAIPALLPFLKGENEVLTVATIETLIRMGDLNSAIQESLLALLGHSSIGIRHAAIAALNALNPPDLVEHLLDLFGNPDPLKRESAAKIMGYLGCVAAYPQLLQCCHDSAENVCQAAIEALPCFEFPETTEYLHYALTQGRPKIRAAAARALALVEDDNVVHYLRNALKDEDSWVRYFAAQSLGEQSALDSLEALSLLAMADPAHPVRFAAITAIGQIGRVQAVPLLTLISQLPNEDLAFAAIAALGRINHADALVPLLAVVYDGNQSYRLKALQALRYHPRTEVITALQRIATLEEDPTVVAAVLTVLAEMTTAESVRALIGLMVHPKRRHACIELLAQLKESHIPLVAEGLKHRHIGVRLATAEVLARMKHPLATEHLFTALSDDEASLRLTAVTCLSELDPPGIKKKLLEVIRHDSNIAVRRAAEKRLNMPQTD